MFFYSSVLLLLFSHSFVSDSFWPHGLQHARLPRPSLSPGVCSNSCPLSPWCHPTISSSVALFSSCPQYFPASGSFLVSRLFITDGQSIGASSSVLPKNVQGWLIWSPCSLKSLLLLLLQKRVFFSTTVEKRQFSAFFMVQLTSVHDYWKNHTFYRLRRCKRMYSY